MYVNPEIDQFWMPDFRIYDSDGDGESKLDHVEEMLGNAIFEKALPFQADVSLRADARLICDEETYDTY